MPAGRGDAVVMESVAGLMVSKNVLGPAVCCGVALSATVTVKLNVPAVVGVPLRTPVEDKFKPAGKVPGGNDHV